VKVLFMGTPSFAVPSLQTLLASRHEIVAVVTRSDRPAGRGLKVQPPPVKALAAASGVPVLQPARIRDPSFVETIRSREPEVLVVVAFGRILPQAVLDTARFGGVNLHASLLPRLRGAAPAAWAIARGERFTGITTMHMIDRLDAGEIYLQKSTPIGPEETAGELEARLAVMGAPFLVETLDALEAGEMAGIPQNEAEATYAPVLEKRDGLIDWSLTAEEIARRVRAFDPWPVAYTLAGGRLLRIRRARPAAEPGGPGASPPGTLVEAGRHGVFAACGGAARLEILEVQPEGRKRITASEAVGGRYLGEGMRLG
jgi:methionyl-tRNA formyltransferase